MIKYRVVQNDKTVFESMSELRVMAYVYKNMQGLPLRIEENGGNGWKAFAYSGLQKDNK